MSKQKERNVKHYETESQPKKKEKASSCFFNDYARKWGGCIKLDFISKQSNAVG